MRDHRTAVPNVHSSPMRVGPKRRRRQSAPAGLLRRKDMEGTQKMPRVAMTSSEKLVVFASSLGTVFEWYDFLLVGALAAEISKHFFSSINPAAAFIFTLLSFAAGFAVRPLGAIVFGRLGDLVGRKYTFLVTIVLMGFATFAIGLLPGFASIGIAAPVVFVALRMLQGL